MTQELAKVKNDFVENEKKQKEITAKIRAIEDNNTQGANKYVNFVEEYGHVFIDGLEPYWQFRYGRLRHGLAV